MRNLAALLALVLAAASVHAADGLLVRERTTANGSVTEVTTYYTADKVVTDAPRQRTVIDLTAKTVTLIDKAAKSYALVTFDALRRQGKTMRERFDAMPEDARKKMTGDGASATIKQTGKTATILDHPAKEYEIKSGPVSGLVWMAEDVKVPAAKPTWDKEQASMRPYARPVDNYGDAIAGLKGIAVRKATTLTAEGAQKPISEQEVAELREATPPADALTVPEGFSKTELPGLN
jgi:hypothetical protein